MEPRLNLDDLRHFLALARHGRLTAAADRLGVEHTTVSRRIAALEKSLGVRLFERTPQGWVPTEAGRRLLPHAEQIEATAEAALADTVGTDAPVAGPVRLVATEAFGSAIVTPILAGVRRRHPGLSPEMVTTSNLLAYRTGEFDIAITLHTPELPTFLTHRLTDYSLRLYASAAYLENASPITRTSDLSAHPMIWYIESLVGLPELKFFSEELGDPVFAFRSSNVHAHVESVAAGAGVGLLPCFLAHHDPRLVPVLHDAVDIRRTFWLVVSRQLANVRRVQVVYQAIQEAVPALRPRMVPPVSGQRVSGAPA